MSCTNCFNGCVETVSDECVRYTGPNVPELNIATGDTLLSVEGNIITNLVPLLTGVGDAITLGSGDVCDLIVGYLTSGLVHTSKDWITALAKGECDLQGQITTIDNTLAILNADYSIDCLTGVTASSDTHAIVQAIITKLCELKVYTEALALDVSTNYVKIADLNSLIAAYLAGHTSGGSQNYLKMVPYTVVEYYGPLTNFDGTGKGKSANNYDKIYLCNGLNGTPDKRGRVGVGAINGVPGGPLDAAVNPAFTGNPNYTINDGGGANLVTLSSGQMPSHTHAATGTTTVTLNDPQHSHLIGSPGDAGTELDGSHILCQNSGQGGNSSYDLHNSTSAFASSGLTSAVSTGVTISSNTTGNVTVSVSATGGGQGHANIQPVRACYYIMYIPS